MSREGKRRRGLTYEDRVLWTTVVKSVKPLRAEAQNIAVDSDEAEPLPPKPAAKHPPKFVKPMPAHKPATAAPAAKPVAPPMEPKLEPLTRRMKSRVARGKQAIDARLDLHGFTQHEAHTILLRFLRNAHERNARLVLVITGKGSKNLGRGGETGVLRRQVPLWLGQPEFRAVVIGFEDAAIAHGGEGALYVRVRRG